jgi:hypothetical protein|tara:strand:- start:338 stop:769 length:432 start_codon:yes stop_codon:yes gene_type:complete
MASNIKYPENNALYFTEGSRLGLLTKVDSDGDARTSSRKKWKAISEAVTDGLLIHYYAEPNSVASINSSMDLDNTLQRAVVDYVKKCLYMDRAGTATDTGVVQSATLLSTSHQKNFEDAIKRYGAKKRDKTGGTRAIKVPDLT